MCVYVLCVDVFARVCLWCCLFVCRYDRSCCCLRVSVKLCVVCLLVCLCVCVCSAVACLSVCLFM